MLSEKNTNDIYIFNLKISYQYVFVFLMLIGIFARVYMLGKVPGGLHQDEAFAGYEAYSLLNYGIDSSGYRFPVYLNTWGSGMNALNTYLMIPFMAIFGANEWVVRLPQVIVSICSLIVLYKLLQKMLGTKIGLLGLLFLSICPWHIMLTRWGLEASLTPGFLLFGLYFFLLGMDKAPYFLLSALCYGLSLYCYATIWPLVPVMILLQTLYAIYTKKLHWNKYITLSILILFVLAIPLLLFLMINFGLINEIKTDFISIPKLTMMRSGDISLTGISENFRHLVEILIRQNDETYYNTTKEFGLFYKGMLIFGAVGLVVTIKKTVSDIKKRKFDGMTLCLIQLVCSVLLGCTIKTNFNRINCILMPITIFIIVGLAYILGLLKNKIKCIVLVAVTILFISFIAFECFYFTTYKENVAAKFNDGLGESVEYALELASDNNEIIYVEPSFYHSKILFYSKMPTDRYVETVQYRNYPDAYLKTKSFGEFVFDNSEPYEGKIYIINNEQTEKYQNAGFEIKRFGTTAVVYKSHKYK